MIQEVVSGLVDDVELLGLVVVPDIPMRLPKVLRNRLRELSGTVPHLWEVPWISEWRTDPYTEQPRIQKITDQILAAVPTRDS